MNVKKLLLAAPAVLVTFMALDFVIHNLILSADYEANMELWRPDMMDKMWIMYVTGIIFSLLFVYVFAKGFEGKGIMEGLRFGVIMWLLFSVLGVLGQYMVYPVPEGLVIKWILFSLVEFLIAGIVVALIYKPKA
jgi:hypothetical protein